MFIKKQSNQDIKELNTTKLSSEKQKKDPLTIRSFRNYVKSQELYTNYLQHQEQKQLKQPKQWTLKQLLNIADRQSQAIQTSRFFNIRSSSKKSRDKSKEKEKSDVVPVVEEKFVEEKIGESARIKLVKILSFQKVDSNGQTNNSNKKFFKLNLSQIKGENQSQGSIRQNIIKINTSRLKEINSANQSMCEKRNNKQLLDIKQKIQNIISATDRKILISYASTAQQLQLTSARKSSIRALKKFKRIVKEILQVVKYMLKYKLWFCYPITYNKTFLQKVQEKQYDQIKNELTQDPELIHIRNQYGQTPLHLACIYNNFTLVRLFIQKHSYINTLDSYELTPLFYAIQSKSTLCLKLLLESNASPWSPPGQKIDQNNLTILMKEMLNQSRMIDILRIWKREVKIKKLVKQFGNKQSN